MTNDFYSQKKEMINDFLDNLAAHQYQKMHKEKPDAREAIERLHKDIKKRIEDLERNSDK